MTIADYQKYVDTWIQSYGVRYFREETNMILLMEEVGELGRLIARVFGEQSFKKEIPEAEIKQKMADEMADILFVLTCLSNQMDIDLEEAINRNMDKKTKRDNQRHKNNPKLK
jgi:NTP pyrophosphatase (non-canonical NTP hydrolase)